MYIKSNGIDKEYSKDILVSIFKFHEEDNPTKLNNQRNILFDYLTSTDFFEKKDNDLFKLKSPWSKNIDALINLCNLEYQDSDFETVKGNLNRDSNAKNYSFYVSQKYEDLERLEFLLKFEEEPTPLTSEEKQNNEIIGFNRIYYGAPGTGKSYGIEKLIQEEGLEEYKDNLDHPNVYRTTFHPDYEYGDFIGQVMPYIEEGIDKTKSSITYKFVPQVFTKALRRSFNTEDPVFLILEEMSRANVAGVFGDIFQLLDRDVHGRSEYRIHNPFISREIYGKEYSDRQVYIPHNLFIIGTVNTSDQNVYVMDTAFKRRFEFVYLPTNKMVQNHGRYMNDYKFTLMKGTEEIELEWINLLNALNEFIVKEETEGGLGLTEDKQLGQFFIKFRPTDGPIDEIQIAKNKEYNYSQITGKLLHYLWEDIQNVTYSNSRIFDSQLKTFSQVYSAALEKKYIFSENLTKELIKDISNE